MDTQKLDREMGKTNVLLMSKPQAVFFSTLAIGFKTVWDDSQPTAYVNGRVIGWNPDFYLSLDREERVFVKVHEVMHVVWKHLLPDRWQGKVMRLWQAACDFAINYTLVEFGFKMPKVGLYDPRFKGMDANAIYDVLLKENYQPPSDMWEDLRQPEQDKHTHDLEVQDMLLRAVTVAKMSSRGAGAVPGDVLVMLNNLLDPKLPWDRILLRWLKAKVKTGYNYCLPNRRYMPDIFLPSRSSKGLKELVVFMDLSSSVTDEQARIMATEMSGVIKRFKCNLTIVTFNTVITGVHRVKSVGELKQVQFHGRGGTRIEPVFEWIDQHQPDAAVIFTDGDFDFEREELSREVVWIINDNPYFQPRFGKAIYYETH